MGIFAKLCEELRSAVDTEGAKGCYQGAVEKYARETGLPTEGLWSVVDGVIAGHKPEKMVKRMHKSFGGTPEQWTKWIAVAQTKPGC